MSQTSQSSTVKSSRVLVIVPAYNEQGTLSRVVKDIRTFAPSADIVVVDDASTDLTVRCARHEGVLVLDLPCNLGVGGAVQVGYQYAEENGYDIAIQFDGDGQHRAERIPTLLEAIEQGADLAVGSRMLKKASFRFSSLRFMGSRLLAWITSQMLRQPITDPTSGFRAASHRAIRFFAAHYPQSYLADTVEALVWASKHQLRIVEVPVRMRQRVEGDSATTNSKGIWHILRIILAILIDSLESNFEWNPEQGESR